MTFKPHEKLIYHITDITNLPAIMESGLLSDAVMAARGGHEIIGYPHIKKRRLEVLTVDCCDSKYVGEFVPFYFCPRSPMLYTINLGNTGKVAGCQTEIIHLVSSVGSALPEDRRWAFSDGNAGACHTSFYDDLASMADLDWSAINARFWQGKSHEKQAEFLVEEHFQWNRFFGIGCHNADVAQRVGAILQRSTHRPEVKVKNDWYY